jgi:hypothetical protein
MPFGSFSPEGNSYSCVPLAKAVRPRYSKDMNSSLYLPFVTIIKLRKLNFYCFHITGENLEHVPTTAHEFNSEKYFLAENVCCCINSAPRQQ